MRRQHQSLAATPRLSAARVCFTADLSTVTGGTPTLTRWALLCGWQNPDARDAFLADGALLRPFLRGAPIQRRSLAVPWGTNYFFARFRPVASSGTREGRDPLAGLNRG